MDSQDVSSRNFSKESSLMKDIDFMSVSNFIQDTLSNVDTIDKLKKRKDDFTKMVIEETFRDNRFKLNQLKSKFAETEYSLEHISKNIPTSQRIKKKTEEFKNNLNGIISGEVDKVDAIKAKILDASKDIDVLNKLQEQTLNNYKSFQIKKDNVINTLQSCSYKYKAMLQKMNFQYFVEKAMLNKVNDNKESIQKINDKCSNILKYNQDMISQFDKVTSRIDANDSCGVSEEILPDKEKGDVQKNIYPLRKIEKQKNLSTSKMMKDAVNEKKINVINNIDYKETLSETSKEKTNDTRDKKVIGEKSVVKSMVERFEKDSTSEDEKEMIKKKKLLRLKRKENPVDNISTDDNYNDINSGIMELPTVMESNNLSSDTSNDSSASFGTLNASEIFVNLDLDSIVRSLEKAIELGSLSQSFNEFDLEILSKNTEELATELLKIKRL